MSIKIVNQTHNLDYELRRLIHVNQNRRCFNIFLNVKAMSFWKKKLKSEMEL